MADIRSEVIKALPYLTENVLSLLLAHLYKLGVEEPSDMNLLGENDLACVLKVVQCRKLLNHFQAFGFSRPNSSTSSPSKAPPETQPCYHISQTSSAVSLPFVDLVKPLSRTVESGHASYAYTDAHSHCIQSETKNILPTQNGTVPSTMTVPPFTISPAFTISDQSSALEVHSSPVKTSAPSNLSSSFAPFTLENNMHEPKLPPKSMTADFEPPFQATGNVKMQAASEPVASSYGVGSSEIATYKHPPTKKDISGVPGSLFLNYQLPMDKLSTETRNILESKVQIRKPFSHELVRVITADLLSKCSNPSIKEISLVAKTCVDAYPGSLSDVTSGRNTKPGYESFLNMIYNRVNNCKYSGSGNEKSPTVMEVESFKPRRVGRPKGNKSMRASEATSSPNCSLSSNISMYETYQIPLIELPQEIQDYLKHNKSLSESSKCLVIQAVVDDLLKDNNNPTQEALKLVAKSAVTRYPGSLKSGKDAAKSEIDFFEGLVEEIKNRDMPANPKKFRSDVLGRKSSASLTVNHIGFLKTPVINLVPCEEKELTPFERWNMLRNYKVPMEKLPLYIQKDLKAGIPIEEETRDEFIEVIIHDALQIISEPTREDLKVITRAIVRTYPDSFQMRIKSNRFTYLGFLKKLMEIAVNITGDENLAFSYRTKKSRAPNVVRDDENNSVISKNEMLYFQSLKTGLQTQSKNEEWGSGIADAMSTTFPLQRLEIKGGFVVEELKDSWPFLFHEKGFVLHLRLLFGSCLKKKMEQNFRDKHSALLNYFVKESSKQESIQEAISEMMRSNNLHSHNRRIVLLILDYFDENPNEFLYEFEHHKEDLTDLPGDPCIITFGNPTFPAETVFSVCIERTLLVKDVPFTTAFIIYFGSYLVFNLPYPPPISHSLEFVQRCLAEIPMRQSLPVPGDVSKKVESLLKDVQIKVI